MALVKWDPFKDLIFLQERMSHIFDEALMQYKGSSGLASGAWMPLVDIYETESKIVLKAELPGVEIGSVAIEVEQSVITLKGERCFVKNLSEENYHRMERFYGTFQREFSLPHVVDKESIKASFLDGVLEITVPKIVEKPEKTVKIRVN